MQRRQFTLTTLGLILLAGCQRQADASSPAPAVVASASAAVAPVPASQAPGADAYSLAATGSGFAVGPIMAAHTVYVFFDPACPHCAHLWGNTQPLAKQMKIVWIPVGFLRPQSAPQAATILAAPNPAAAMAENEASVSQRGPGIKVGQPDEAALAKVKANTALLERLSSEGVPLIVFRNRKTGQVGLHAGAVEASELLAMAGA